ncbi:MAG: bifunctional oligoribonuclease/PAP phosphatase NrnA [Oscillospiraceae bacterium]|nr:bifunctional oligoribonuclease/PAP phosphatase NrnA [Oscillospiraceae bacterium]
MTDQQAAALLRTQDSILILTHIRPDGDTIGCAAGLCALLRQLGKTSYVLPSLDVSQTLGTYLTPYLAPADFSPSFIVAVDTAALSMLQTNAETYQNRIDLAIDHHGSHQAYAKFCCVDSSCAACGELIYRIALTFKKPLSHAVALPLYMAIATDTGCFQYSNTTADTHYIAGALIETGIDHYAVNRLHFRTKSLRRMHLEARLISTMEFWEDGAIAISMVPQALLDEIGATKDDTEDLADLPGRIAGVEASVTVREQADGTAKISLRTSPSYLNASAICAQFDGGGHPAAAGCSIPLPIGEAKDALLAVMLQALSASASDDAGR